MVLPLPIEDMRMRCVAQQLMIKEHIVRNRIEYGGSLTAHEIIDGVRLSHEEFLELARLAMPALNDIIRKTTTRCSPQ